MNRLNYLFLSLAFSFISTISFSQIIPTPNGGDEWDYCECVEGVQAVNDTCPCEQIYPTTTTGGGTTTPEGGIPDPTGNPVVGGSTFVEILESLGLDLCFFFPSSC